MHPALSILLFTTLAGAGQGLVVCLGLLTLLSVPMPQTYVQAALASGLLLLAGGLLASFFHLGHKSRAWRAVLMWRTSWMSREVIVMPVFMAMVAAWLLASLFSPAAQTGWAWATLLGALLLWHCTAMIYVCLKFIQEWAHPLTTVNFVLIGLYTGASLACAMASTHPQLLATLAPALLTLALAALSARLLTLLRNARLKPRSTLQSATGIQSARLRQISMGISAGSFNTREFFHGASALALRQIRWLAILGLFVIPLSMQLAAWHGWLPASAWWWVMVFEWPGLLAERWLFFAQARHPQNLYYQTVA
jgi:DMSO reductase anchor subunit